MIGEFEKYKKGQVIPEFKGVAEGARMAISDSGIDVCIFFAHPTAYEIEQFDVSKPFTVKETVIYDSIISFTFKIGNLNWIDAPFTPHLAKDLTRISEIPDGMGFALRLYLIDSVSGTLCSDIRLISLGAKFSRKLIKDIEDVRSKPFDEIQYYENLDMMMRRYTTKDIVDISGNYFKIK